MSDYFQRLEGHLLDAVERRARGESPLSRLRAAGRRLTRRRSGLLALGAVLLASGSAAGAVLLSGEPSRPLSGVVPPYDAEGHSSTAGARYSIALTPSLQAGTIGWCDEISFIGVHPPPGRRTPPHRGKGPEGFAGGDCGTGTPAVGDPLFAVDGEGGGGVWYVLTAPQVAAVRMSGGPTVLTRSDPRLPFGFRAAVFYRSHGGGPGDLTALDRAGEAIPGGAYERPAEEPTATWTAPAGEPRGACGLSALPGSGLSIGSGTVVTAVSPDTGIIGRAFLSCADAIVGTRREDLAAAVLLDAKDPGARPAQLPGTRPVAGAPGVYLRESPLPRSFQHRPLMLAERAGDAWLVVAGTQAVGPALRALRALRVSLALGHGPTAVPRAQADAECSIQIRPTPGLREVSQHAFLVRADDGSRLPPPPRTELATCAGADFYDGRWPIRATVLIPWGRGGLPRILALSRPVPGHPGMRSLPAEGGPQRDTLRRVGRDWLEAEGGTGAAEQRALLDRLSVRVASSPPGAAGAAGPFLLIGGGFF